MKSKKYLEIIPFILILVLFISCSKIDKDKFTNLYQSTNEIEGAIKVGINYLDYSRLLQKISSAKEMIDTTGLNDQEKKLYKLFDKLFIVYTHSHIIWNLETEMTSKYYPRFPSEYILYQKYPYESCPNERVLYNLVRIYDLNIETIEVMSGYDGDYKSNKEAINRKDAVNKIWLLSSSIFSQIKNLYNK